MSLSRLFCALVLILPAQNVLAKDPPQTNPVTPSWKAKLFGMRGFPAIPADMTETKFFPLIDEFGQYRHADWPGKTHSASELAGQKSRGGRRPGAPSRVRRSGTLMADGNRDRNLPPRAAFAPRSATAGGGWSIRKAGSSGRTASTASTRAGPPRRSATASSGLPACPPRIRRWASSTAKAAGRRTTTTKASATRPTTSRRRICCGSTATIGGSNSTNCCTAGCEAGA